MKRIKRIVDTSFWSDEKVMNFSPEDKYFWLFLLTNEYTTQLGVYYLPIKKAAFDLGYSEETVRTLLDRFENKYDMIRFSDTTDEVAIKNYLLYSIVKGGKPVYDCLVKEQEQVKDKSLLVYIYNNLSSKDISNTTVMDYVNNLEVYVNINNNDNENERIVACDFLRLKEMVIQSAERKPDDGEFICEWCGNKVSELDNHHFPVPRSLYGKETVGICKECHRKFHTFEYQNRMGQYAIKNGMNKSDDNLADINDELQKAKKESDDIETVFEMLWKMYPRKKGKGSIKQYTKRRIFKVGFETMKKCIDRYKKYVDGKDEQYIMYGSTFFNSGYVDYLDENYAIPDEPIMPTTEDDRNAGLEKYDPEDFDARARHPYEDGWRINSDGYWQRMAESVGA